MELYDSLIFNVGPKSSLKEQPRQHISNVYIYLYVSYQSVYTMSESQIRYFGWLLRNKKRIYAQKFSLTEAYWPLVFISDALKAKAGHRARLFNTCQGE